MPVTPPGFPAASPDRSQILALRDGDREAFAAVFRAWYPAIVRFIHRYVEQQETAEDIAQEVFIIVWERRSDLDPARSFKAYLYTIARRRALNVIEHERVAALYTDVSAPDHITNAVASVGLSPGEVLETADLIRIAEARVALLSPRLREIYHLTRHDGLAPAEVAELLGSSVQTVYKQVAQIVKVLHPVLDQWRK